MWRNFKFIVEGDVMVAARFLARRVCVSFCLGVGYFYL